MLLSSSPLWLSLTDIIFIMVFVLIVYKRFSMTFVVVPPVFSMRLMRCDLLASSI